VKVERQNVTAAYWTLEMAAKHFGITPATVRRYIREGLPVYYATTGRRRVATCVNPIEYTLWKMDHEQRLRNTHLTASP
jgi:predicted site-specific integrase-resolvase